MKTMETDAVQEYILESQENLRIALAVHDAWSKAGPELISGFFGRLRSRLEETLKGWEFDYWGDYMTRSDAGLSFGKPKWKGEYYVALYIYDHGQGACFGLGREANREDVKDRERIDGLLTAIKERYQSASNGNRWWEAEITMDSPTDWRQPEVFWRMLHEKDPFLEELAQPLLEVAEISAPIVDEFVRLARKK